ncbi:MAG: OB-fold nucleic acid binding domain-containing protein [Thermoplasmata archaeon]
MMVMKNSRRLSDSPKQQAELITADDFTTVPKEMEEKDVGLKEKKAAGALKPPSGAKGEAPTMIKEDKKEDKEAVKKTASSASSESSVFPPFFKPPQSLITTLKSPLIKSFAALCVTLFAATVLTSFYYAEAVPFVEIPAIDSSLVGRVVRTEGFVKSYYNKDGRWTITLRTDENEKTADINSTIRVVLSKKIAEQMPEKTTRISAGALIQVKGRVSEYNGVYTLEVLNKDDFEIKDLLSIPTVLDLSQEPSKYLDRLVLLSGRISDRNEIKDNSIRIIWDGSDEIMVWLDTSSGQVYPVNSLVSVAGIIEYSSQKGRMEIHVRAGTDDFFYPGDKEKPDGYISLSPADAKNSPEGTRVYISGARLRSNYELTGTSFFLITQYENRSYTLRGLALNTDLSMDYKGNRINSSTVLMVAGVFKYSAGWLSYYLETGSGKFEAVG